MMSHSFNLPLWNVRNAFKQTPFKSLNSGCISQNRLKPSRSIILMSNQVFVLLCDLVDLLAVVLLMSFKLSFIPYYCSRTLAVERKGETLQYLAKDISHVMTKSVFISWAEINHAFPWNMFNANFPSTHCVLCLWLYSYEMVGLMCHHRWGCKLDKVVT